MSILKNKVFLLLTLTLIVGALSCVKIYSFDYWTHLYLGKQYYLKHSVSLASDLLNVGSGLYSSFFPVLLYSISATFGDPFVSVLIASVFASTFACYLFLTQKIKKEQLPVYLLAICILFFFARIRLVPRPEIIAYLLQALVMWLIMSAGEKKLSLVRVFAILSLLFFWRTVHVSWFFGVFFVVVYQLSERLSDLDFLSDILRRKFVVFFIVLVVVSSVFVFRGIFNVFIDNFEKLMLINEMQPLWIFPEYFIPYAITFSLFVSLNLFLSPPSSKRVVLLMVFCGLGALIARNSVFFLFAALPYTAKTCSEMSWNRKHVTTLVKYICTTGMVAIMVLIVVDKDPEVGLGVNANFFPIQSMEYVSEYISQPVIFNDLDWGGYILWRTAGKITPFIDGRLGAESAKFNKYGKIINSQSPGILLQQYGIDTILTRGIYLNSGRIYPLMFFMHFNKDWYLVNADDGLVFTTIIPTDAEVIDKKKIWEMLLKRIEHVESLDGDKPHLLYSRGSAFYMLGDPDRSREVFKSALEDFPELRQNYSMFLQGVGL